MVAAARPPDIGAGRGRRLWHRSARGAAARARRASRRGGTRVASWRGVTRTGTGIRTDNRIRDRSRPSARDRSRTRGCSRACALLSVSAAAALLLALPPPREAAACSQEAREPYELDPSSTDPEPPARPELVAAWIERFHPSGDPDEECSGALARLHLELAVDDNRTAPGELGFETVVVAGEAPFALDIQAAPVRVADEVTGEDTVDLVFRWGRSAYDDPVDVRLEVTAVDPAGNRSEPLLVEVVDPGAEGGGCRVGGGGGAGGAAGLALALVALGLRRRRRAAVAMSVPGGTMDPSPRTTNRDASSSSTTPTTTRS